MTTPKLSSEKLLDISLLKNLTRRRAAHILLAFLMNFFTLTVPIIMAFGEFRERYPVVDDIFIRRATNEMEGIVVLNLVFTFALAVYFGVITLGYMMKRRSAHFYHALPQKRETLYMTSIASALLCAALGAAVNLAIATVELYVFGVAIPEVITLFFTSLFKNLVFFITTYAITLFAGSFSGNGLVQVLMTLVIMLYPLATYYGVVLLRSIFATYFNASYFFENEVIEWFSPFAYAIVNYFEEIQILPTVIALLVTVALVLGGNEIYRRRAIENSEKPIVFKTLGSVLKYMLMFTVTVFAGVFFYVISNEGIPNMIFGFVCGAVLSFMLFNTILEKSPKAMFKGIKGLAIFAAAFALYSLVFCFDVFNMDDYIPNENSISYAEISIPNVEYDDTRFDDPEMLKALVTVLKNQQNASKSGVVIPSYGNRTSFRVEATMYNKLGMPIPRVYEISKYIDGAEEFLKLYADDARMDKEFTERIDFLCEMRDSGYVANYTIRLGDYRHAEGLLDEFIDTYVKEFGIANYDRLSKPLVGYVSIYDFYVKDDYYSEYSTEYSFFNEMPIFEDMVKTVEYIESLPFYDESTGEYVKYYEGAEVTVAAVETTDKVGVIVPRLGYLYDTRELVSESATSDSPYGYNLNWYPVVELSNEQTEELYNIAEKYSHSYSIWGTFVAIDTDYAFRAYYDTVDKEMEEKYGEGYNSETYVLPKGKIPESIKALFN